MKRMCEKTSAGKKNQVQNFQNLKAEHQKNFIKSYSKQRKKIQQGLKVKYRSTDVNLKAKTIKFVEENTGVNRHDLGLSNGFY